MNFNRLGEERLGAEAEFDEHHERHEGRAAEQQTGLDDLHPGGGNHAAKGDVGDHQSADDDHGHPIVETKQQLDKRTGANHLGNQLERHSHERAAGRQNTDGRLTEAERGNVGECELAEVAQGFRD